MVTGGWRIIGYGRGRSSDEFRHGGTLMATQYCPICGAEVMPYPRYPRYVCHTCAALASSVDGRRLEFSNVSFSGGFIAHYADTGEEYPSQECFINGVRCFADEARFGGIVIQAAE